MTCLWSHSLPLTQSKGQSPYHGPMNYLHKLALAMGACHLPPQGLSHVPLHLLIFNTPRNEFKVETRNEAFCALGKTGRTGL